MITSIIGPQTYISGSTKTSSRDDQGRSADARVNRIVLSQASNGESTPSNATGSAMMGAPGEKDETRKIVPNGIYLGAFLKDGNPSQNMVDDFQQRTGQKLDIVTFFRSFQSGFRFPAELCKELSYGGSAAFIKLEPRSHIGDQDDFFSLERINSGAFDDNLRELAMGAADFNKPVFMSFAHEMNGTWYPWGGKPEEFVKAYKRVVDIFNSAGASNVTWVWNINNDGDDFRKYYPGDDYVDWIGVDGYSSDYNGNPSSASQLFERTVFDIRRSYNKPIMIGETAYDDLNGGTLEGKAEFLRSLPVFAEENDIKGLVIFDQSKIEQGKQRDWALNGLAGELAKSIRMFQRSFDTTVRTIRGTELNAAGPAKYEAMPPAATQVPLGPWKNLDSKTVKSYGPFRSATALVYGGNIILTSAVSTNDFGVFIVLRDEIEGEIKFASSGKMFSGEIPEMTIQFLSESQGIESLLSEAQFPLTDKNTAISFKVPKGTNKINIIHFGSAALKLQLTDVMIRDSVNK